MTPAVPAEMARVAAALGVADAAGGLWDLARRLGAPAGLAELGLSEAELDRVAELAAARPAARSSSASARPSSARPAGAPSRLARSHSPPAASSTPSARASLATASGAAGATKRTAWGRITVCSSAWGSP